MDPPGASILSGNTSPVQTSQTETAVERNWHVVVLNDPVNLMSYVVMVFRNVFGFDVEIARRHMLEVHHLGRSRLWTGAREKAEAYVHTLQTWQLSAVLEQDG